MSLDPCTAFDHVSERYRRLCLLCWFLASIATAVIGFMIIFIVLNRSPAIDYGGPQDMWLEVSMKRVDTVHSGEIVDLVFARTTWLRLCKSDFAAHMQINGAQGRSVRFDLPIHKIVPPPKGGLIRPPKAREIRIPLFGDGVTGQARLWADVSSYCWPPDRWWWPIVATTPTIHLMVE